MDILEEHYPNKKHGLALWQCNHTTEAGWWCPLSTKNAQLLQRTGETGELPKKWPDDDAETVYDRWKELKKKVQCRGHCCGLPQTCIITQPPYTELGIFKGMAVISSGKRVYWGTEASGHNARIHVCKRPIMIAVRRSLYNPTRILFNVKSNLELACEGAWLPGIVLLTFLGSILWTLWGYAKWDHRHFTV